jgi:hypothetical protein
MIPGYFKEVKKGITSTFGDALCLKVAAER